MFTGIWKEEPRDCSVEYKETEDQVIFHDVEVCPVDFDPIVSSIVVTCDVDGQGTNVPQSDTNGWSLQTIGGKQCLVFTGTWSENALTCSLEYRDKP